ncbi:hypothetical protein [Arthrobacter crystallopoietes]|uniref:Uncharacterized protein n=1 Tax=Crystallibacter crystallopoietes TaxID=37928 RepID=A0A1H1I053_9MICC|nr:hypothetical protein [Arthrobacter crystallopoietes]SDR31023.1 hypothetical protein SAMN04489742_4862 [Arthrobacter crystallopoietes]
MTQPRAAVLIRAGVVADDLLEVDAREARGEVRKYVRMTLPNLVRIALVKISRTLFLK